MRTLFHAALLAGSVFASFGVATPTYAADLDHYYVPHAAAPPCGVYRPCFRPYPRFGYVAPPYRFDYRAPPYHRAYDPYNYDHNGYGRPRENVDRYGYDRPAGTYERLGYERLERYGDEERRYENQRFERPAPVLEPAYPYDPG